jgi:hypothetical protein
MELNNIFNELNNKLIIDKIKHINTIIKKNHRFLIKMYFLQVYVLHETKEKICSDINFTNKKTFNRTTFYRKEQYILYEIYKQLSNQIYDLHNQLCNDCC